MNSNSWQRSKNPSRMLESLGDRINVRKLRLFGVACCNRIAHLIMDRDCQRAVRLAVEIADADKAPEMSVKFFRRLRERSLSHTVNFDCKESRIKSCCLDAAVRLLDRLFSCSKYSPPFDTAIFNSNVVAGIDLGEFQNQFETTSRKYDERSQLIRIWHCASTAVLYSFRVLEEDPIHTEYEIEVKAQTDLIRDIFGNPFRPVTLDPRWLSSTVLDLARTIYDERVYERMPILGDALTDAGCDSDEIIQHCQGPGPHVRGCWVVDLLLAKS